MMILLEVNLGIVVFWTAVILSEFSMPSSIALSLLFFCHRNNFLFFTLYNFRPFFFTKRLNAIDIYRFLFSFYGNGVKTPYPYFPCPIVFYYVS